MLLQAALELCDAYIPGMPSPNGGDPDCVSVILLLAQSSTESYLSSLQIVCQICDDLTIKLTSKPDRHLTTKLHTKKAGEVRIAWKCSDCDRE